MAITTMAPRSSMMANAVRNTFNAGGTLSPSKPMMAMAKAMSVAVGIPAPERVSGWLKLKRK